MTDHSEFEGIVGDGGFDETKKNAKEIITEHEKSKIKELHREELGRAIVIPQRNDFYNPDAVHEQDMPWQEKYDVAGYVLPFSEDETSYLVVLTDGRMLGIEPGPGDKVSEQQMDQYKRTWRPNKEPFVSLQDITVDQVAKRFSDLGRVKADSRYDKTGVNFDNLYDKAVTFAKNRKEHRKNTDS